LVKGGCQDEAYEEVEGTIRFFTRALDGKWVIRVDDAV